MKSIKTFSLILLALIVLSFAPAFAASGFAYSGPPLVYDEPGILADSEKESLTAYAAAITDRYDCTVAFALVNSLNGYQSVRDFADDFFIGNGYGEGTDRDGIMLLVSLSERKMHQCTSGRAIDVFTDAGLGYIEDRFLSDLSSGRYSSAARIFFSQCEKFLGDYEGGTSYDVGNMPPDAADYAISGGISLAAGLGLGGLPLIKQKKSMKTVHPKTGASDYKSGGMRLSIRDDRFITKDVVRTRIPRDNGGYGGKGGHGGSTIHTSSSGHTFGGRSGSF